MEQEENLEVFKMMDVRIRFKTYDTVYDIMTSLSAKGVNFDINHPEKFLHEFAIECNYAGISIKEAKSFIEAKCGIEEYLITDIVDSVYKKYADKFALKALIHNLKIENNHDCERYLFYQNDWKKLPCIPIEVFQELPQRLAADIVQYDMRDLKEQETFMSGAESALHALFDWVL